MGKGNSLLLSCIISPWSKSGSFVAPTKWLNWHFKPSMSSAVWLWLTELPSMSMWQFCIHMPHTAATPCSCLMIRNIFAFSSLEGEKSNLMDSLGAWLEVGKVGQLAKSILAKDAPFGTLPCSGLFRSLNTRRCPLRTHSFSWPLQLPTQNIFSWYDWWWNLSFPQQLSFHWGNKSDLTNPRICSTSWQMLFEITAEVIGVPSRELSMHWTDK